MPSLNPDATLSEATPTVAVPIEATQPNDPNGIFRTDGPINPSFIRDAVRTLMRALPIDPDESRLYSQRRMYSAMCALAALHPRDEIEIMLAVQTLSAYHAAAACWRIGMNHHSPCGDSTRHISAAATAARAFDTLLRAIERRQVKPLALPDAAKNWGRIDPAGFMRGWEDRCKQDENTPGPNEVSETPPVWKPEALAVATDLADRERIEMENQGLDLANTEGILPGGGMIVPEDPTPQQAAYLGRRLGLGYRREHEENHRKGIHKMPKIRPIRPGDLIL